MALSLSHLQDYIHYHAIHKNWKEIEILLSTTKFAENEMCIFWNAVCCLKRRDTIQSRNLFKQIASNSDYNLASISGLVETYLIAQQNDDDDDDDDEFDQTQISKLKSNIKKLSKTENIQRLMNAAVYFWHIGRLKQARHYAEKGISLNQEKNANNLAIIGWIYLSDSSSKYTKKAPSYFANALSISHNEKKRKGQELALLPIYGLTRCYQLKGKLTKSIECITQLIVHNQWFIDGLTVKSELQILFGQYQQCIDTINRLLNTSNQQNNIQCLVIKLCYFLMYNGNYNNILKQLQFLYKLFIQQYELNKYPSYSSLFYNISNITSKFIIHSTEILEICQKFISIAVELEPENSTYLTLQGNLYLYLGYIQTALQLFRDAATLDDNNIEALYGAIYCRILNGDIIESQQELQFLTETIDHDIHHSNSKKTHNKNSNRIRKEFLNFLQGIIAWKSEQDEDRFNYHIKSALEQYIDNIRSTRFSEYFDIMVHDPRFCIMIINEYLKHAPSEPLSSTDPPSIYLNECNNILQELCERIPGMIDAHLLYAKCKYLEGDIYGSESILLRLKEIDNDHWKIHLLQCQVALYANSNNEAQTCLDTVIGLNFQIQSTLIYHIIKSKLLQSNGLYQESIKLLETIVDKIHSYIDEKNKLKQQENPRNNNKMNTLSQKKGILFSKYEQQIDDEEFINLCINIIIQLSQLYKSTNQINKAKQLMNKARSQFEGENEQILIRLSEVRMLLKQGEIDAALANLHGIPSTSSYYTRSRLLIADIYLKHKRNKKMYIECFEQLINDNPNDIHCQLLLGDAYMNIQSTSSAIHCYEQALMISDYDEKLSLKFGRALITSHDYQRAILHFEATLANNIECSIDIKAELAELYIQFEEYDKAKRILTESIAKNTETFHDLQSNVKMLCLFAELYQNVKRWDDAKSLLVQSWSFQQKLISMANSSGKDIKPIEKIAAEICYHLGFVFLKLNNISMAEELINKSIEYDIQHEKAIIEMAKLYEMKGNHESATEKLKSVLSMNQNNENAVLLLVNIYIDHQDLKTAITELRLFRGSNLLNIRVLLQLIKLLKRTGKYDNIKELMEEMETLINNPTNNLRMNTNDNNNNFNSISVGMHYIKGYVSWYIDNDGVEAINQLNEIRNDINWGPQALILMIKIYLYLNPGFTFIDIMNRYCHLQRDNHLEICQILIKELKYFKPGHDATILSIGCLLLMASSNNNNLEKAYKTLNVICKKNPKHILSHLSFGIALYLKDLPNKAIQFLNKFILDNKDNILINGYARYLYFDEYQELVLTLLQLQLNKIIKNDMDDTIDIKEEIQIIQKMCLDILKNDASSSKAWELCAIAAEKQNNINQSCKYFETAWNLHNKKNGLLGYSFAKSLLKNGKYIECIDIAHQVLDDNKDFKQIHLIINHALTKLRE